VTRELLSGRAYVGTGQRMPAPLPVAPISAEPVTIARKDDEPAGSAIDGDARDADEAEASEPRVAGVADDMPSDAGEGVEFVETVADAGGAEAEADAEAVAAAIAAAIAASGGTGPLVLFVSDDRTLARDHGYAIARDIARLTRTVLVDLPGAMAATDAAIAGIGDVVAGRAGFVDVLHRDPASRLHLVAPGTPVVTDEQDWAAALGRCLEALQGTYGCVIACAASPAVSPQAQAIAAAATVLVLVDDAVEFHVADALLAALPPGSPVPLVFRVGRGGDQRATA
jgi:hypothetical protein